MGIEGGFLWAVIPKQHLKGAQALTGQRGKGRLFQGEGTAFGDRQKVSRTRAEHSKCDGRRGQKGPEVRADPFLGGG